MTAHLTRLTPLWPPFAVLGGSSPPPPPPTVVPGPDRTETTVAVAASCPDWSKTTVKPL